jgi:hypothetical protein
MTDEQAMRESAPFSLGHLTVSPAPGHRALTAAPAALMDRRAGGTRHLGPPRGLAASPASCHWPAQDFTQIVEDAVGIRPGSWDLEVLFQMLHPMMVTKDRPGGAA